MITRIYLENFKAFRDIDINLSPLTLFTGKNGMGKSSLIQSLLLLRQSYNADNSMQKLVLNGSLTQIGFGKDVYNINGDGEIKIQIECDQDRNLPFVYTPVAETDILPVAGNPNQTNELKELSLFNKHFQYLNAERIAPQRTYEASPHAVDLLKTLGKKGQFTVHFLDKYKFETIPLLNLKHSKAKSSTLLDNVNAWLSEISSEIRVKPKFHPELQISTLNYEFIDGNDTTPEFMSLNTGFGITYVLPVIVALLSAKKDDLLIFENPESHLHPQGQAILGHLIARAAQEGVQILVESHSDHLFNGMRVAIKEGEISANNFSAYFFSRCEDEHSIYVEQPLIDENGRISFQPEDFFDEFSKQLTRIIKKD